MPQKTYSFQLLLEDAKFQAAIEQAIQSFSGLGSAASNYGRTLDEAVAGAAKVVGKSADDAGDKIKGSIPDALRESQREAKNFESQAGEAFDGVESQANELLGTLKKMAAAFGVKEIVQKIINVRGEMQQLQVAFETMLGSQEQAVKLMSQLTETAATTPFGLTEVANGAKQLLAYGTAADKVNETLIRLGDIAAGLSIPLGDLVYLYGTTQVQGRLYTQDLNQFTGRGIPLISELAKQFGVAESKVKDLVTEGKVGFPEVQRAIEDLTDEGGKFGGLMKAQSATITGQISNIEDAIDMMLNNIGQSSEGLINSALSGVSYAVEHYEQMGRALAGVALVYGTYKAAVIAAIAIENAGTASKAAAIGITRALDAAQAALNKTLLTNPYVAVAAALAALVAVVISAKTETERLQKASEDYEAQKQAIIDKEKEHKDRVENLLRVAENEANATSVRRAALLRLSKEYPSIFAKYDTEAAKLNNIASIKREIAALDGKNTFNETKWNNERIQQLEKKAKRTVTLTGANGVAPMTVSGLTGDERMELKNRLKKRDELYRTDQTKKVDDYFLNLTKVSPSVLQGRLKQVEQMQRAAFLLGDGARVKSSDAKLWGTIGYSYGDLEAYRQQIISELNRRAGKGEAAVKRQGSQGDTKAVKGSRKSSGKADAENEADEAYNLQMKELERKRLINDLENEVEQARIDALSDNSQKKLDQMSLDHKKEIEALDKEREDYLAKKREDQRALFEADAKNKGKVFGYSSVALTADEAKLFDERKKFLLMKQQQENAALQQAEEDAQNEYLEKYGTAQEQLYAIAQRYAQKIASVRKANGAGSVQEKALVSERDSAISQARAKNLALDIDWGATFEGIGTALKDIAKETLEQVESYMKTKEFKGLSAKDKQTYTDLRTKLQAEAGTKSTSAFNFGIWGDIANNVRAYQDSVRVLREKTEAHTKAVSELEAAQDELRKATEDTAKAAAQTAVGLAKQKVEATGGEQVAAKKASDEAKQTLTDNTNAAAQGIQNFTNYLNEMSTGSLYGFANGLAKLVTSLQKGSKGVGQSLAELGGKVGGIVGAILQIIDALGDDPKGFIDGLLNKVANVLETVIGELPDIIVGILNDVVNIVQGVFKGLGKMFGFNVLGGYDWKEYNKMVKMYNALNEQWDTLLEKKREYINESWGTEAANAGREADALVKAQTDAARKMGLLWSGAGAAWNSHSQGYKLTKGLSDESKALAKQYFGADWIAGALSMSPDKLKELMSDVALAPFWAEVKANASDFYGYLETIAAESDKLKENAETTLSALTFTDFDSLKSNFVSMLTDMSKSAKDFSEDIEKQFRTAVINGLMNTKYNERLKKFYEKWAALTESGNKLTADEAAELKKEYEGIVSDAINDRNQLATDMGWSKGSSSQGGSSSGFDSMSQDTANELNGRFTAIQMDTAALRADTALIQADAAAVRTDVQRMRDMMSEANNIALLSMGHLEDISRNTYELYDIRDTLNEIRRNTQRL